MVIKIAPASDTSHSGDDHGSAGEDAITESDVRKLFVGQLRRKLVQHDNPSFLGMGLLDAQAIFARFNTVVKSGRLLLCS